MVIGGVIVMAHMYQALESMVKEHFDGENNDEIIAYLHEAIVGEDDYLRHRISERFDDMMKSLFAAHKEDALPDEQEKGLTGNE